MRDADSVVGVVRHEPRQPGMVLRQVGVGPSPVDEDLEDPVVAVVLGRRQIRQCVVEHLDVPEVEPPRGPEDHRRVDADDLLVAIAIDYFVVVLARGSCRGPRGGIAAPRQDKFHCCCCCLHLPLALRSA